MSAPDSSLPASEVPSFRMSRLTPSLHSSLGVYGSQRQEKRELLSDRNHQRRDILGTPAEPREITTAHDAECGPRQRSDVHLGR
jgi:hypothetical protein